MLPTYPNTSSYSNVKVHLAAIKHFNILLGYHTTLPPLPRLYMLTRSIKRRNRKYGKPRRQPVMPTSLNTLHHHLNNSSYCPHDRLMLWAAVTTAFFGFLRASEFVAPTTTSFNPEATLLVHDVTASNHGFGIQIKSFDKPTHFAKGVSFAYHQPSIHCAQWLHSLSTCGYIPTDMAHFSLLPIAHFSLGVA